jgi:hypothetical protein
MAQPESLLARLNRKPIVVAPGVYELIGTPELLALAKTCQ